jgi:tetratricopeptide (TPR) repeat protein
VPADHTRIDDLRRRIQQDPASIAFAQLAEECRRMGELDEAVSVCRAGLAHHPGYVSAHVTLGRALMALGQHEEARAEFEQVLRTAPDNLVALRCLEELGTPSRSADSGSGASDVEGSTIAQSAQGDVEPREQSPEAPRTSEPSAAPSDTALYELEGLLAAIRSDRASRGSEDT